MAGLPQGEAPRLDRRTYHTDGAALTGERCQPGEKRVMSDVGTYPQRLLSICAGAGGLDLGVHMALRGARTIGYVEYEATACAVLEARIRDGALDDAPIWTDANTFDGRRWRGCVDGLLASYPCQPFSVAGKRLGASDPRHLWPRISELVRDVEPEWCFFENVRGHVRLGLREVWGDLRRMGYGVHAGIFSAAEVGAPHRRERLFILAHRDTGRAGAASTPVADAGREGRREVAGGPPPNEETDGREGRDERESNGDHVVASRGPTLGGVDLFPPGPGDAEGWRRVLAVRPDLAPALTQPEIRVLAHGLGDGGLDLSRAAQLRIAGNGVVPQQAAFAFRTLAGQLGRRRIPRTRATAA